MKRQREFVRRLEEIPSALIWVFGGHLLAAALIWYWVSQFTGWDGEARLAHEGPQEEFKRQWFHPARFVDASEFLSQTAKEEEAALQLLKPATQPPPVEADARYITLFRRAEMEAKRGEAGASERELALLNEALDRMDQCLYEVFMSVWRPPGSRLVPPSKRVARLDVTLNHQAHVEAFHLAVPSGSPELDLSVVEALESATRLIPEIQSGDHSLQFPQSLPSNFPDQRYECRIQFQIE